jgi:hypothetical protein
MKRVVAYTNTDGSLDARVEDVPDVEASGPR